MLLFLSKQTVLHTYRTGLQARTVVVRYSATAIVEIQQVEVKWFTSCTTTIVIVEGVKGGIKIAVVYITVVITAIVIDAIDGTAAIGLVHYNFIILVFRLLLHLLVPPIFLFLLVAI